jgi:hypothetical protein
MVSAGRIGGARQPQPAQLYDHQPAGRGQPGRQRAPPDDATGWRCGTQAGGAGSRPRRRRSRRRGPPFSCLSFFSKRGFQAQPGYGHGRVVLLRTRTVPLELLSPHHRRSRRCSVFWVRASPSSIPASAHSIHSSGCLHAFGGEAQPCRPPQALPSSSPIQSPFWVCPQAWWGGIAMQARPREKRKAGPAAEDDWGDAARSTGPSRSSTGPPGEPFAVRRSVGDDRGPDRGCLPSPRSLCRDRSARSLFRDARRAPSGGIHELMATPVICTMWTIF